MPCRGDKVSTAIDAADVTRTVPGGDIEAVLRRTSMR
jgi:hypothetical protein